MSVLALVAWMLLTPVVFIATEVVFGSLVAAMIGGAVWWLAAMLVGIALQERTGEPEATERAARG